MGWFCPRCGRDADQPVTCRDDGERLAEVSQHDLVGRRLGAYKVLAVLGGGGFGTVYRAVHARSGMAVAIKLLHRPCGGEPRVLIEARAAASIKHRSVVEVYDLALTTDRRPYIVMQLLDGRSLRDALSTAPVGLTTALAIARDVLGGLAAAHARGVVHRDLKPDNIVLANGRAMIVDFGLAKLVADPNTPNLTATGDLVGTPAYLAPEQIRSSAVDHRADLYAFGCVMFDMLTGHPPFVGTTFQLLSAHQDQPAPPLIGGEIPPHVAAAVARALAKAPADRFRDAHAMARALAGKPERAVKRPAIAAGLALAGGSLAAGIAIAMSSSPTPAADAAADASGGSSPGSSASPPAPERRVVIPPPNPNQWVDPKLEITLRAVADALDRGLYSPAQLAAMRCSYDLGRVPNAHHLPEQVRAFYRRATAMIDSIAPELDHDCDNRPTPRLAKPAPLVDEPPLGPLEETLDNWHRALDTGSYSRDQARFLLCSVADQQRRSDLQPAGRALFRRLGVLIRLYFPDLDPGSCGRS